MVVLFYTDATADEEATDIENLAKVYKKLQAIQAILAYEFK